MLKDFLDNCTNEESAMEAVSSMAVMIGEDPIIACESDENAEATSKSFKSRISGIVQKIKAAIRHAVEWIKTKLFNLFKVDSYEVDHKMWADGQKVLSLCDKTEVGALGKAVLSLKANMSKDDEKLAAMTKKVSDRFESMREDEAYTRFMANKYGNETISVKGSALENQRAKFQEALSALQDAVKVLETSANHADPKAVKGIQMVSNATNLNIKVMNTRVLVLNRFINLSGHTSRKKTED